MELSFPGEASDRPSDGTSRFGAELRVARERLGWEVDAVAEALRLKPAFIRAIEQGDLAGLPAPAYSVGFVRIYATALGLDPNEAIRRFRGERDDVNRKTELAFPAPVPQRGVPAGALILVGTIVAIGGYIGWYHYSGRSLNATMSVDDVPAHLEPLAPPTSSRIAMQPPAVPAKIAPPASVPMKAASNLPDDSDVSPSSAAAAVPMPPVAPTVVAAITPPAGQAVQGAPDAAGTPPGLPGPMVIQVTADAWIEIKTAAGKVVYQAILHPGGSYTVPAQPKLTLTTGNAPATEVVLSGNAIGPLKGHVLRNIPLDAASLKAVSVQTAGSTPTAQ
jgi:cytoskeleton protein RodZ